MTDSYTTTSYGAMLRDDVRLNAYLGALKGAIVPGESVVLELGTGTGIVAFAAVQFGAKHVYALEPNSAIEVARAIQAANAPVYRERITFVQEMSLDWEIPERADILISDMRGITPLLEYHIPSLVDARERLLKPSAVLISKADTLYMAPLEAPRQWRRTVGFWDENLVGLDMSAGRKLTANQFMMVEPKPDDLLAERAVLGRLEFDTVTSPNISQDMSFEVRRDGVIHGFSVWFETEVDDDVRISTAPGERQMAYGQCALPLERPLSVSAGDVVELSVAARLVGENYIWRWRGSCRDLRFDQSTFYGSDVSLKELALMRPTSMPSLNDAGDHARFVLSALDGRTELGSIADKVLERWPERFADRDAALSWVAKFAAPYLQ